jgi:hypothetical protein
MVGAGRDRPVMLVPVRVDLGIPGRALAVPVMVADGMVEPVMGAAGKADGMGPLETPAVSRFAVRQAELGMRFAQAVGANAVPLSGAAVMASAPTEIAPPAVMLPVIGCTEPAAAQIGPSSAIGPDLSVALQTLARRSAAPLIAVPLSAVPLTGDPSIAVLAAVPLAVPQLVLLDALVPAVLGPAGRMGPGPIVAILLPPALTAAEIGQAPGR